MHLGVLATAHHALRTCTMFTVYYKPRLDDLSFGECLISNKFFRSNFHRAFRRSSQFIVGVKKFLEAMDHRFSIGMRFNMRFEGEDTPERRYTLFIVS